MRTLEQEFAEKVYAKTAAFGAGNPKGKVERDRYGAMAHKLPILVQTAGLAQALAFVQSRGKDGHKELLRDLAQVVFDENDLDGGGFAAKSRTAKMQEYVFYTRRTMLALKWFKRFAQSVLDVDPTQEGE